MFVAIESSVVCAKSAESSWTEILSGQKFCLDFFFANPYFLNLFKYI